MYIKHRKVIPWVIFLCLQMLILLGCYTKTDAPNHNTSSGQPTTIETESYDAYFSEERHLRESVMMDKSYCFEADDGEVVQITILNGNQIVKLNSTGEHISVIYESDEQIVNLWADPDLMFWISGNQLYRLHHPSLMIDTFALPPYFSSYRVLSNITLEIIVDNPEYLDYIKQNGVPKYEEPLPESLYAARALLWNLKTGETRPLTAQEFDPYDSHYLVAGETPQKPDNPLQSMDYEVYFSQEREWTSHKYARPVTTNGVIQVVADPAAGHLYCCHGQQGLEDPDKVLLTDNLAAAKGYDTVYGEVIFADGSDLVSYDIPTGERRVLYTSDGQIDRISANEELVFFVLNKRDIHRLHRQSGRVDLMVQSDTDIVRCYPVTNKSLNWQ